MTNNEIIFWKDIIKQDYIKEQLINSIVNNKLFHAYLFTGIKGIGKTTIARTFAKSINCLNFNISNECCFNCKPCLEGKIDILEIDGALYSGVAEINKLITRLKYAPLVGEKKILILDEVQRLSAAAFSAFLCFAQKPPKHVILIFITNDENDLPEAIVSRFLRFKLEQFNYDDIKKFLQINKKKTSYILQIEEDDFIRYCYRISNGSLRDVVNLIENFSVVNERIINFETKKEFKKALKFNTLDTFMDYLLNLMLLGCNLRDWFYGLVIFLIFEKKFKSAANLNFFLFRYKKLNNTLVLSTEIFEILKQN